MTDSICDLIEKCKLDKNPTSTKDFIVAPLLKDNDGFMIFSNDKYYSDKTDKFSKIAQKHFKKFPQRHRFYIYNKLNDNKKNNIIFILYNPSYATPEVNDPTINNCIYLAQKDGRFSSVEILNLYSERNPIIKNLAGANNKENINFISKLLEKRQKDSVIVLAWENKCIPSEWKKVINSQKDNKNFYIITSTKNEIKTQIRHPGNQGWSRLDGFKNTAKLINIKDTDLTLEELLN